MHIDLSEYGLEIQSFDMRRLTGVDSDAALERIISDKIKHGYVLNTKHKEAMIADAITHVNGVPVVNPFVQWQSYGLKLQEFIVATFDFLNIVPASVMETFLGKLKGGGSTQKTTTPQTTLPTADTGA